jgi:hypothetical protein
MHTLTRNCSRRRRGGAIIDIVFAIVFFGLLAFCILWIIKTFGQAGEQYSKAMVKASKDASVLRCELNMRSIYQCVQAYATENDSLPSSREELVRVCEDSRLLRCDEPNGLPYVYIAGQRLNMPESNVLVYEPVAVHEGRSVVLYLSGRIDTLDPEALKRAVGATQSRIRGGR